MCPQVESEGWLRWFAHPSGGGVCRGHAECPAFAPGSSEVAAGFLISLLPEFVLTVYAPSYF